MIVPMNHILMLSTLMFALGMFALIARRNLIMMLLGIEIMLNAGAVAFVGAALQWRHLDGQALVIFILAVAATEVSVGLAMILGIYRRTEMVDPALGLDDLSSGGPSNTDIE